MPSEAGWMSVSYEYGLKAAVATADLRAKAGATGIEADPVIERAVDWSREDPTGRLHYIEALDRSWRLALTEAVAVSSNLTGDEAARVGGALQATVSS